MVLTRHEFVGVVRNAIAGLGFAAEEAMVTFPIDLFLVESDLSPIKQNVGKFIEGLTKWEPTVKRKGILKLPKLKIEGRDYEEAATSMNTLFLRNLWSDGLPLLPPTEERVNWILRGIDISPDTEIGKIMPKSGIATVETLAVSLAMAGGRPEYLPVLIAAVEAIIKPELKHQQFQATSCSVYPVVIVNGPIAKQIRLNSGFGLLGPDPQYPAGGSIGRAIRLLQQNAGGALPGVGTMSTFSGMRYTNAVFAEDEEGLPSGWEPLNVEYLGHPKGVNTVAVSIASSATNILRRGTGKENLDEEAITSLHIIASYMRSFNVNSFVLDRSWAHGLNGYVKERTPGILLLPSTVASQLASLGWTKKKIKEFLWENTKIPLSELKRTGFIRWIEYHGNPAETLQDPWPITSKPENIMIVVAGGRHPTHAYWMQSAFAPKVVSREIKLPVNWNELIKEAEEELGPLPMN
ncbi:hypothetical protein ACFLWI_05870 [Chloroflexota bacterium]